MAARPLADVPRRGPVPKLLWADLLHIALALKSMPIQFVHIVPSALLYVGPYLIEYLHDPMTLNFVLQDEYVSTEQCINCVQMNGRTPTFWRLGYVIKLTCTVAHSGYTFPNSDQNTTTLNCCCCGTVNNNNNNNKILSL